MPCIWSSMYSYHFNQYFDFGIQSPDICICIICVVIIYISCNWHFITRTWFWIQIFWIPTGLFKNIFSFNRFFYFIIVFIYWVYNVLKITNCFFILVIRNGSRFYFSIQCYNICIRFFNIINWLLIMFFRNSSSFYFFINYSNIYRSF